MTLNKYEKKGHRKSSLADYFLCRRLFGKHRLTYWLSRLIHGNRKSLPKKEQDRIRPHTPKVKRVREISWISPTKTCIALHHKKETIKIVLKNDPQAHATYGTNLKLHDIFENEENSRISIWKLKQININVPHASYFTKQKIKIYFRKILICLLIPFSYTSRLN